MGNRGILHDAQRSILHYHRHKNWVICKLSFKDYHRVPMTPHTYTELFFLDEATALAAGHRPCARCNRAGYNEFVHYWRRGNPTEIDKIDVVLHRERFKPYRRIWRGKKRTHRAPIDTLPSGTFIVLNPDPTAQPYLVFEDSLLPWRFDGYEAPVERRTNTNVILLTPPSTVRAMSAGYQPAIYPNIYGDTQGEG